jgi:hypothetical protein
MGGPGLHPEVANRQPGIHDARREARRSRLKGEHELPERVDAWLAAWEAQADAEGRPHDRSYWGPSTPRSGSGRRATASTSWDGWAASVRYSRRERQW